MNQFIYILTFQERAYKIASSSTKTKNLNKKLKSEKIYKQIK